MMRQLTSTCKCDCGTNIIPPILSPIDPRYPPTLKLAAYFVQNQIPISSVNKRALWELRFSTKTVLLIFLLYGTSLILLGNCSNTEFYFPSQGFPSSANAVNY